jgi:hypothetical protein
MSYPVYILDDNTIVYTKDDMDHIDFWEQEVVPKLSIKMSIPISSLMDLPYCQKRGRVVGKHFYCGEKVSEKLMDKIREILGEEALCLVYDDHEKRLKYDYQNFKNLKGKYAIS